MAQGVRSRDVVCPFYLSDDNNRIKCEGYLEGMVSVHQNFEAPHFLIYYMRKLCCAHYWDCEIYQMINRVKYLEEE